MHITIERLTRFSMELDENEEGSSVDACIETARAEADRYSETLNETITWTADECSSLTTDADQGN